MTLPRVSASCVKAGEALDRAGSIAELEAAWTAGGCDNFRRAERNYLFSIYRGAMRRIERQEHQLKLARAY